MELGSRWPGIEREVCRCRDSYPLGCVWSPLRRGVTDCVGWTPARGNTQCHQVEPSEYSRASNVPRGTLSHAPPDVSAFRTLVAPRSPTSATTHISASSSPQGCRSSAAVFHVEHNEACACKLPDAPPRTVQHLELPPTRLTLARLTRAGLRPPVVSNSRVPILDFTSAS